MCEEKKNEPQAHDPGKTILNLIESTLMLDRRDDFNMYLT